MIKNLFFFILLALLSAGSASAQPGNPCDPTTVSQFQADLINEGFTCLQGAGPFACIGDVVDYAFANCPPNPDTTNNCDPVVVAQVQADLLDQGFACLQGAGPFACVDDVINYALTNCPPDSTGGPGGGDPCDPVVVNQCQNDLIAQGFECLEGAGPFPCLDDLFNYLNENCPPIDTTWGNPCDPAQVAQLQADLIAQGFECLEGAGPFACVEDVFNYAFENCPPVIDTTGGNPCDPVVVNQCQNDLIAQGYDCLIGAGPFVCLDELFNYLYENCPPVDTTWGNSCDSVLVGQLQNDLIAQGFDCLEGAGPFACVDDVFNYIFENCPPVIDTTGGNPCDSNLVWQVQTDLIAQGFDCLEGAGPFACVDDVFNYAFENCAPPIDTTGDCDPASVQQAIDDLLAQGYDCLIGAGPFTCVHEVVCYALDNCSQPIDTTGIPPCLLNIPPTVTTFQQFINYLVDCDSSLTAGIPSCWFEAPVFATDEAFLEWITINCGMDSLMSAENDIARAYFNGQSTSGVKDLNKGFAVTINPNPATTQVTVQVTKGLIERVELMDLNGRRVISQNGLSANQARLNLAGIPSGMYTIRIYNDRQETTTRLIVKE